MSIKSCYALILAVVLGCAVETMAKTEPIIIGNRVTLQSDILDEERSLMIYTPPGYNQSNAAYPVMYLLDSGTHFHHVSGLVQFLFDQQLIPQMIVVGVQNTDRTRDLTPPTTIEADKPAGSNAGGGDVFLRFIRDELQPYIAANLRAEPYSILVGHSFGGLLTLHALARQPDMFNAYVAVSPSLWWNDRYLIAEVPELLIDPPLSERFMHVSMGDERNQMVDSFEAYVAALTEHAPEQLRWSSDFFAEEDHNSIVHRAIYHALEALYEDWRIDDVGAVIEATGTAGLSAHYADLSERFGYPIEAPEPVMNLAGYTLLAQGRVTLAIETFHKNVARYPDSPNVYDSLGDGYRQAGELEKARESYARAVELGAESSDPNLDIYRQNLKQVELDLQQNSQQ